jgi:hypothetical protein
MNKSLTASQQQRFQLIELKLMWVGELRVGDLIDAFGISRMQASMDIRTYRERHPRKVNELNRSTHCYTPTISFRPDYASEKLEDYLHITNDLTVNNDHISHEHVTAVPVFRRNVLKGASVTVMLAARLGKSIKVIYASASSPSGSERIITPSRIVYAVNRSHVRAYCNTKNEWRDFVLSRFLNPPRITNEHNKTIIPPDQEWDKEFVLNITPNPKLPLNGQELIASEYGIDLSLGVDVKVNAALFNYFLIDNNIILGEAENPWERPLVISNSQFLPHGW